MPGSKLRRTWPLDGGMSAQMAAIEVETPIGQTVKRIVRWHNDWTYRCNPHAVVKEFKILQLAHTLTGVPPHKKGRTAILLDWVARGTDYFLEGEEKPLPGRSTEYRERRLISNTCLVQMAHI